jgi:uncharacterized integral membrane protein (TIGR00698 family)
MGMKQTIAIKKLQVEEVHNRTNHWLYTGAILLCFLPFVTPAWALFAGIGLSLLGFRHKNLHAHTAQILQASIVLLGFGMNLADVVTASKSGFIETVVSVTSVMIIGIVLGRIFKVEKNIALLISSGTAICGGSAIAAVAPILKSEDYQNSFALIVVFVLNALALFLFPFIGHQLGLSQEVFGNWAAIAIHDTSSVVGAGAAYGEKALQVATTVKLIRALWIIPLSLVLAMFHKKDGSFKIKFPWFILFFVMTIVFANALPQFATSYMHFHWLGQRGMVIALLLIGSNITIQQIKQSGARSFLMGVVLWIATAVSSLFILTR